jgi:prepilin-type N-terminal cleavage/methylation domain-containing protein
MKPPVHLPTARAGRGFTLLELLIVIAIIALVAGLAAPTFRKASGGGVMAAATRQLVDDLALARIKAITERTTVYVVFLDSGAVSFDTTTLTGPQQSRFRDLLGGQFTDYALFVRRSVGDQPGRSSARYVTEWKSLPEGVFMAGTNFINRTLGVPNPENLSIGAFPFPDENAPRFAPETLAYLAFDPSGQLVGNADKLLWLARGSVFNQLDVNGEFAVAVASVIETPAANSLNNFNRIRINWLTGRTRVERPELP